MLVTESEIALLLQQYILPFCRIGMMVMVMPVISSKILQNRVRLLISLLVTILVVPLLPELPNIPLMSWQIVGWVIQELLLGLVAGFLFQVVFQVFILAGQFLAMKMGLGFASMNDPTNGVQTTVLSQFFLMLTTLVFISIDGHLILMLYIVESFQVLPPGRFVISASVLLEMASLGQWMFASALLFALPVMTSLLFVNIAFGVMSRAAPQLNIFAVGFPFTLVVGLFLIWVGFSSYLESFERVIDDGFLFLKRYLKLA